MPDLSGKVAIVTGAASGIGKTTSETLARHGASVVVAGHSRDGAEEVAAEIRAHGGEAIGIGVEVTDEEQVKAMVGAAVATFGGLDCLHNNAAATKMHRDSDVVNVATEVWDETMAVNLHGLTRHVANAYGKQNIRCNAIALGMIMTEAAERNVPAEMITFLEEHNALARLGKTADVAEVVAFLFSDQASFITGEVIAVDGGFTSHLPALVD